MTSPTLTKSDKKVVRELMDAGLQTEFRDFKHKVKSWVNGTANAKADREWFWELHKMLETFRKHIGRRYDNYTGSCYPIKMLEFFMAGMIPDEAMARFSPDFQEWLKDAKKRY